LSFLDDAVHAGKINYIGLSNFTGWEMQLTLSTAKAMGVQVPVTLQQQYSLVSREIEYENVPAALHNNIGLLPWSPLAAGFLSGKYRKGEKAGSDTRAGSGNPMNDHIFSDLAAQDQNWATLDVVRDIAASNGVTPSQVAYSWVANPPAVTALIVGAKTLEQLEQNLIAGDLVLGEDETVRQNGPRLQCAPTATETDSPDPMYDSADLARSSEHRTAALRSAAETPAPNRPT
jgi:aryl-alcohol dehydrogenase-like predicted oxidoreductase